MPQKTWFIQRVPSMTRTKSAIWKFVERVHRAKKVKNTSYNGKKKVFNPYFGRLFSRQIWCKNYSSMFLNLDRLSKFKGDSPDSTVVTWDERSSSPNATICLVPNKKKQNHPQRSHDNQDHHLKSYFIYLYIYIIYIHIYTYIYIYIYIYMLGKLDS